MGLSLRKGRRGGRQRLAQPVHSPGELESIAGARHADRPRGSAAHACAPLHRRRRAYQWAEVGYEADDRHDTPAYALGHFLFSGLQVSPFIQSPGLPAQDGQAGGRDARQDAQASPRVQHLHQPRPGPRHRGLPAGRQALAGRPRP